MVCPRWFRLLLHRRFQQVLLFLGLLEKYDYHNFKKVKDPVTNRYKECELRGIAYLDALDSFKYKDYLWYKNIKRLLSSTFTFPCRNDHGFVVGLHKDIRFSLSDLLHNMRDMYNDYNLYLLNKSYRSQELVSQVSNDRKDLLSFYPVFYKQLPLTCSSFSFKFDDYLGHLSLYDVFKSIGVRYVDVYRGNFIYPVFVS